MATNYRNRDTVKNIQDNWRRAQEEYDNMKNVIMRDIVDYLKETRRAFTAKELSNEFGLSVRTISGLFYHNRPNNIRSNKRRVSNKLVYLNENGEPVMDRVVEINRTVKEYYYEEPKYNGYW
jgi:predicted transcriptional regulator